MFRKNSRLLSPIPEEEAQRRRSSPCNVRRHVGGREDDSQDSTETDISRRSVGEHGEDVEASGEDEEHTASESVETDISRRSVDEHGEDVEASGEDEEQTASESVETDISRRSVGEHGEDVEASGEDEEETASESVEIDISRRSMGEHGDVEGSGEDEEQTTSESVAETTDGSPKAGNLSPEDVQTPEAMRRQRKSRLTDIIPFGRRDHSVVKDVTPPAAILALDLSGALADSLNSPHASPAATSSPNQRPGLSRELESPLPELVIEVEKKRPRRYSDSEEFFNRLEITMGKLARKYILNEVDDTWSFDSGVQIFESTSPAHLDDFTEGNVNGTDARQNVERVASDSHTESKDANGKIDHKKSSEVETSEAIEICKRSVLKDITPQTLELTMPRIADEEIMQNPHYQGDGCSDQYGYSDRGVSMHSSDVLEEEQSNNDEDPEQDMEGHASESLTEDEPEDEEENDEEALEEEVERSGSDSSAEAPGESAQKKEDNSEEAPEKEVERGESEEQEEEEEDNNEEKPAEKVERSASEDLADASGKSAEEEEEDNSEEAPEEEAERSELESTDESEEQKEYNSEEKPVQKVERSASEGLADASSKSAKEEETNEEAPEEELERSALKSTDEAEDEEGSDEEAPEEEMERSQLESIAEVTGEPEEEEETNEEGAEQETEQSASENLAEASGEPEDDEVNDEDAPEEKVERITSEGAGEDSGKLEAEVESNAESSREAVEQRASESHAVTPDAREEPEILSRPDILSPEAMRRRRSSKITMISPVEKSKHSELKDFTPPAQKLSVQRITDEGLIQPEEHTGEEEADICEDVQEEVEQATVAFAKTPDASPVLVAAPSKHIQWKSSCVVIGNYLESDQTSHAQKIKRIPIRDNKEGEDTKRSFKRRRLSQNRQGKEATDLDEIVPFYSDGDPTRTSNENRKDSDEACSPALTPTSSLPTQERVSPIISFVSRRKPARARTAPMTQSCSPLPELNIEIAKKYSEADSDTEEFFNRLEKTMTKLARKYILKIEDDTESFDSGVEKFERLVSDHDALDSNDDCFW